VGICSTSGKEPSSMYEMPGGFGNGRSHEQVSEESVLQY
jgi:hypothetical protein